MMKRFVAIIVVFTLFLGVSLYAEDWTPNIASTDLVSPVDSYKTTFGHDSEFERRFLNWVNYPNGYVDNFDEDGDGDREEIVNIPDENGYTKLNKFLTNPNNNTNTDSINPEWFNLALSMAADWTRDVDDNGKSDLRDFIKTVYNKKMNNNTSYDEPDYYAYLSPTLETQFNKELATLANELEYNPVKIYEWVYENIKFENYELSRKGALATFRTKRGNEWDQCSLLIALLRMSGIPARYILANGKKYQSVPGVLDNPNTTDLDESDFTKKDIVAVQLWINSGQNEKNIEIESDNSAWVTLIPWHKDTVVSQEGIDLCTLPGSSEVSDLPVGLEDVAKNYLSDIDAINYKNGIFYTYHQYFPIPNDFDVKTTDLLPSFESGSDSDINVIKHGFDVRQDDYLPYAISDAYRFMLKEFYKGRWSEEGKRFALIYSGYIKLPVDGDYTFSLGAYNDSSAVLYIDGNVVVNNIKNGKKYSNAISFDDDNKYHKIQIKYFHFIGAERALDFTYSGPGFEEKVVPESILYLKSYDKHTQKTAVEYFEDKVNESVVKERDNVSIKNVPQIESIVSNNTNVLPLSLPRIGIDGADASSSDFVKADIGEFGTQDENGISDDVYRAKIEFGLVPDSTDSSADIGGNYQILRAGTKRCLLSQIAGRSLVVDFDKTEIISDNYISVPSLLLDSVMWDSGKILNSIDDVIEEYKLLFRFKDDGSWRESGYFESKIYQGETAYKDGKRLFLNLSFDSLSSSQLSYQDDVSELEKLTTETVVNSNITTMTDGYMGYVSEILSESINYRLYNDRLKVDDLLNVKKVYSNGLNDVVVMWTYIDFTTDYLRIKLSTHDASPVSIHQGWSVESSSDNIGDQVKFYKRGNHKKLYGYEHPLIKYARKIVGHSRSYNQGRVFEDWQGTPSLTPISGLFIAMVDPNNSIQFYDHENYVPDDVSDNAEYFLSQNFDVTTTLELPKIVNPYSEDTLLSSEVLFIESENAIGWLATDFVDSSTDSRKFQDIAGRSYFGNSSNVKSLDHARISIDEILYSQAVHYDQTARRIYTGGDPVDLVTGEFYLDEKPDLSIKSRGLDLQVIRKYRSQAIYNGPFGYGWSWNHAESLLFEDDNTNVTFFTYDRKPYLCRDNGDGTYELPPGSTFTLKRLELSPDNIIYQISEKTGFTIVFSSDGLLTEKHDTNGNKLTFEYDGKSRISTIVDSVGRGIKFLYNTNDKIVLASDYSGRSVSYIYNNDDLITFVDSVGSKYQYKYNTDQENPLNDHNISKQILPDGDFLEISYYKNDRVACHTNKIGNKFNFQYSWMNRYTETWSESGYYKKVFYNDKWDVIRTETENSALEYAEYDFNHNMISHVDGNGNKKEYLYDNKRNLISKKLIFNGDDSSGNQVWYYEYKNDLGYNRLVKRVDPSGTLTEFEYDGYGNKTKEIVASRKVIVPTYNISTTLENGRIIPVGGPDFENMQTAVISGQEQIFGFLVKSEKYFFYDLYGNLLSQTQVPESWDRDGEPPIGSITSKFLYDVNNNNLILKIDPEGNTVKYSYDDLSRLVSKEDQEGFVSQFTYDNNNRKITVTDKAGGVTRYVYDANGRLFETVDPRGSVAKTLYGTPFYIDHKPRVIEETDPLGNSTVYKYDPVGYRIQSTDRNGNITKFKYDELGRLIQTRDASGNVDSHRYDANGNKIETIDSHGNVISYVYDAANRKVLTRYVNPAGSSIDNTIHPVAERATKYEYDLNGNVTESIEGYIDTNGDVVGLKTTYKYDVHNRRAMTTVNDNSSDLNERVTNVIYDTFGRVLAKIESNIRKTAYTYDLNGKRLSEIIFHNVNGSWEQQLVKYWEYNTRRLVSKYIDGNGTPHIYKYDELGRKITDTVYITDINDVTKPYMVKTTYDSVGNQIRSETFSNNMTVPVSIDQFTYNKRNEQITVTAKLNDTASYTTSYEYDPIGNRISMTDPDGYITNYYYDVLNRNIAEEDARGSISRTEYDALDNEIATIPPLGERSTYAYNRYNQVVSMADPLGHVTTNSYDEKGRLSSITDTRGNTTVTTYTDFDEIYSTTVNVSSGDGLTTQSIITTKTYDNLGRLLTESNPNETVIKREYDALDRVTRIVQAYGEDSQSTTDYFYDANGNQIRETRAHGSSIQTITESQYDQMNRLVKTAHGIQQDPEFQLIETKLYDDENRRVTVTDPYGMTVVTLFDSLNRQSSVTDQYQKTTIYTYDKRGNLLKTDLSHDSDIENEYDEIGRLVSITQDGDTRTIEYDANSRVIKETDYNGNITQQFYDQAGRRIRLVLAATTVDEAVSKFEYDEVGNLIKVIDANHADSSDPKVTNFEVAAMTYEYDELNRLIKEIDADGTSKTVFYDHNSNAIKTIRRDGSAILREYDALDRLVQTSQTNDINTDGMISSDEKQLSIVQQYFEYDLLSRMTKAVDYNRHNDDEQIHTITYAYDFADRLITEEGYDSFDRPESVNSLGQLRTVTTSYGVDTSDTDISQVITGTYPNARSFTFDYDRRGNLKKISDSSSSSLASYVYDDQGRSIDMSLSQPSIATTRSFDDRGRESYRSYSKNAGILYDQTSLCDSNGNLENEITTGSLLVNPINHTYTYDYQNRLTDVSDGQNWDYDPVGNWEQTNQNGVPEVRHVNDDNEYEIEDDLGNPIGIQEDGSSVQTAYDHRGNMTQYGNKQFIYDWANRLVQFTDTSKNITAKYTYDARNRRVSKFVEKPDSTKTIYYAYAESQVVQEYELFGDSDLNPVRSFVYGLYVDEPVLMVDETAAQPTDSYYYYLRDRRASVVALVDSTGQKVETYEYTAFGLMLIFDDAGTQLTQGDDLFGNPYGFTGRRWDAESELWYYRNRMYSAELGRFLTRDPLGYVDGYNMYAYVSNRPYYLLDPNGTEGWLADIWSGITNAFDYVFDGGERSRQAAEHINITWDEFYSNRPNFNPHLLNSDLRSPGDYSVSSPQSVWDASIVGAQDGVIIADNAILKSGSSLINGLSFGLQRVLTFDLTSLEGDSSALWLDLDFDYFEIEALVRANKEIYNNNFLAQTGFTSGELGGGLAVGTIAMGGGSAGLNQLNNASRFTTQFLNTAKTTLPFIFADSAVNKANSSYYSYQLGDTQGAIRYGSHSALDLIFVGAGVKSTWASNPTLRGVQQYKSPIGPKPIISTGRTNSLSLTEQLAMAEVMSNPNGNKLPLRMSDTKNNLLFKDGWVKMSQHVRGVKIHYVENVNTGEVLDFKFKD